MRKLLIAVILLFHASLSFAAAGWTGTATIPFATDNVLSPAVELPGTIKELAIVIPTITSSTVFLKVSHDGVTYQNLYAMNNGTNQILWATAAATGGYTALIPGNIGLWRYVKVGCGSAQAADRTFTLVGK